MKRYLTEQVRKDLEKKMVFVAGARQVGKTTLAKQILKGKSGYLNWDVPEDRERILRRELPAGSLWAFDEIHKYRAWRNYLKGLYDAAGRRQRILVTGSARLDFYRYGGDSLQGRYHLLRLHPLSAAELGIRTGKEFRDLLTLGGWEAQLFERRAQTGPPNTAMEWRLPPVSRDATSCKREAEGVSEGRRGFA